MYSERTKHVKVSDKNLICPESEKNGDVTMKNIGYVTAVTVMTVKIPNTRGKMTSLIYLLRRFSEKNTSYI